MLKAMTFCSLLAACSGPSSPPPAPASLPFFDPELALRRIDQTVCPEYSGALAISEEGLKLHLLSDVRFRKHVSETLIGERGMREMMTEQRDSALKGQASNEWWARWGIWIGAGGTAALATITAVIAAALSR